MSTSRTHTSWCCPHPFKPPIPIRTPTTSSSLYLLWVSTSLSHTHTHTLLEKSSLCWLCSPIVPQDKLALSLYLIWTHKHQLWGVWWKDTFHLPVLLAPLRQFLSQQRAQGPNLLSQIQSTLMHLNTFTYSGNQGKKGVLYHKYEGIFECGRYALQIIQLGMVKIQSRAQAKHSSVQSKIHSHQILWPSAFLSSCLVHTRVWQLLNQPKQSKLNGQVFVWI